MHTLEIASPGRLSDILRSQRIALKMSCGGHGSCKTCRVILDGEPVLACQTDMEKGVYDLGIPQSAATSEKIRIDFHSLEDGLKAEQPRWTEQTLTVAGAEEQPNLSNSQRLMQAAGEQVASLSPDFFEGLPADSIEGELTLGCFDGAARHLAGAKGRQTYAIAVDVGTTTVSAALIDLAGKNIAASGGQLNGQYAYAEDLVARIAFCRTPELLKEMQELGLKRTLAPLLRALLKEAGVARCDVAATVLSGNAPMIHILLGLDPSGMGGWPFNGVDYAPAPRPAGAYGLPGERLEFAPAQSSYLGGDVISGLALIDFENQPEGTLFVDLGTNAEMALKAGGKLLCTAAPAGPAFEGGGLPCGTSAVPGAIDHVWEEEGELRYSTIEGEPAMGLCGSGIISFVAAAFRARILRKKGRYARRHPKVEERELHGEIERVYALTEDIYVSETDVSNFLQAKAAVFSGSITLCKLAGMDIFELEHLWIGGNFGQRVRIADIMDIGIIPPLKDERISICGNTSLKGAIRAALDGAMWERMERLSRDLEFIELNAQESFQDDFINALFIPHLRIDFAAQREEGPACSA